jgi:cysteine-rich repeat protein
VPSPAMTNARVTYFNECWLLLGFLAGLVLAGAGCDVYDPALYRALDAGATTPDGGAAALAVSDRCEQKVPLVRSSAAPFAVDTSKLGADYRAFAACAGGELPGNEGFVAIDMAAGERWHVHVSPALGSQADPAIYILPACDERTCQARSALDQCGAGQAEHMSFVAPRSAQFLLGIDSRQAGGGRFDVLVVRPTCGNGGMPEHAESCDDGNTVSGDGCDARCRSELAGATAAEVEPNDDAPGANVLLPAPAAAGPAAITVSGRLGGGCDVDVFAVSVPAGGAIRAEVQGRAGRCADGNPPVRLTLLGAEGDVELGAGAPAAGNACARIDERHAFARDLPAGTYYLRASADLPAAFEYQLRVERP